MGEGACEAAARLMRKGPRSAHVIWVKGHAADDHVSNGKTNGRCK